VLLFLLSPRTETVVEFICGLGLELGLASRVTSCGHNLEGDEKGGPSTGVLAQTNLPHSSHGAGSGVFSASLRSKTALTTVSEKDSERFRSITVLLGADSKSTALLNTERQPGTEDSEGDPEAEVTDVPFGNCSGCNHRRWDTSVGRHCARWWAESRSLARGRNNPC